MYHQKTKKIKNIYIKMKDISSNELSDNFSFFIKNIDSINIIQDCTFEYIVSQMQKNTSKILCIFNYKYLRVFDKESLPSYNLTFEKTMNLYNNTAYYFRLINTEEIVCVFGEKNAKRLGFKKNTCLSKSNKDVNKKILTKISDDGKNIDKESNKIITIIDNSKKINKRYKFKLINYPIIIEKH